MGDWKKETLNALTRMSLRHGRNSFTRQEIIDGELANIIKAVKSKGQTPAQTLSRVLQKLRDEGYVDFEGRGAYLLLQSTVSYKTSDIQEIEIYETPERHAATVHRIMRDSGIVRELKRLYAYKCQVCGTRIELSSGFYCEAHHLKPLGAPHNGPDIKGNIIIVCPNDHVRLDYGAIHLSKDMLKLSKHDIASEFINYHNEKIFHKLKTT